MCAEDMENCLGLDKLNTVIHSSYKLAGDEIILVTAYPLKRRAEK